jgi:hypothetical protein
MVKTGKMILETLDDIRPGYQLAQRYTLVEHLGSGGEAEVWSGLDGPGGRVVAIRLLHPSHDPSNDVADSFQHTVSLLTSLVHPNLVNLSDYGATNAFDYTVMEYIPTGSLDYLLRLGGLPPKEALRLAAQMASALDYIHGHDVVHRDLKPTNILLDSKRRVYLTDFGLARRVTETTRAYHTGRGTAPYAPPEQHLKQFVSPRSDIYSLGLVLYEMFTGNLPWDGDPPLALRQLDDQEGLPDPRDEDSSLPSTLATALRVLTAVDPDRRPASAPEAFDLVAQAFEKSGPSTRDLSLQFMNDVLRETPARLSDATWRAEEAQYLLGRALATGNDHKTSRTHFAFMDVVYSQAERYHLDVDDTARQFMLRGALTHGHNVDHWWQALDDPDLRLGVCEEVITREGESAAARAMLQLVAEPVNDANLEELSPSALARLVDLAAASSGELVGSKALDLLGRSVKPATDWQAVALAPASDRKLANLALGDGSTAKMASWFIGRTRSETAVAMLLDAQEGLGLRRALPALVNVREVAGGLPPSAPAALRLRLTLELARQQLLSDRATLLRAYAVSALGSALGLGFHAYMTYRGLPGFLDFARILVTLGNGMVFGPLIGLGIFLARLVVQRLRVMARLPRLALGTAVGALVVNLGIVAFHSLALGVRPTGGLIGMGSILIALGFGIAAGMTPSAWRRSLVSTTFTGLSIGLSWQLFLQTRLTPVLYYEFDQPIRTVLLVLATALLIGAIPHLADLPEWNSKERA